MTAPLPPDPPGTAADSAEARLERARRARKKTTAVHVRALADQLRALAREGAGGRAAAIELLRTMDRDGDFSPAARSMFQDLLGAWGVATPHPIAHKRQGHWSRRAHTRSPLIGFGPFL